MTCACAGWGDTLPSPILPPYSFPSFHKDPHGRTRVYRPEQQSEGTKYKRDIYQLYIRGGWLRRGGPSRGLDSSEEVGGRRKRDGGQFISLGVPPPSLLLSLSIKSPHRENKQRICCRGAGTSAHPAAGSLAGWRGCGPAPDFRRLVLLFLAWTGTHVHACLTHMACPSTVRCLVCSPAEQRGGKGEEGLQNKLLRYCSCSLGHIEELLNTPRE